MDLLDFVMSSAPCLGIRRLASATESAVINLRMLSAPASSGKFWQVLAQFPGTTLWNAIPAAQGESLAS
jgi:hypothetical protein